MFVDLLYKMSLIYYYTLYLQKNNFWHYVYVKFNTFSVKYIFEKNAILSYKLFFNQIRFLELYWLYSELWNIFIRYACY